MAVEKLEKYEEFDKNCHIQVIDVAESKFEVRMSKFKIVVDKSEKC